jgi:AcrR family transcriptional regulator
MMRITAQAKEATRQRVLDAARKLFAEEGFEAATTREIAQRAGIANGTLFNYFPTKESMALTLVAEALAGMSAPEGDAASLEEELFAYIAAGLRRLKPYRNLLRPVLETAFSPVIALGDSAGQRLRVEHLEEVARLILAHTSEQPASPVVLQLYWTLYTGVLGYWAADTSPNQEDTLAVLDASLKMFVAWLCAADAAQADEATAERGE